MIEAEVSKPEVYRAGSIQKEHVQDLTGDWLALPLAW
jgi:hypothetical protein